MQKTELSKQDLKIYQSERLYDLSDGGGFMTHKALTGKKGELFNPISDLEQIVGSFDMRLVYPAVNTDGVEQLQGAHFIISEPAQAKNVGFVAMAGEYYGEERKHAVSRAEAYAIATVGTNMTLFGDAVKGSRFVRVYMEEDEETPKVGERYCLDDGTNSLFFRIAKVESTRRRFYDDDGKAFYKKIVSIETVSRITIQFTGATTATKNGGNAPTKIKETQAADTSQYYGIKPLSKEAHSGDMALFTPSIMESIVPTTVIETAYADQFPAMQKVFIPLSDELHYYSQYSRDYAPAGEVTFPFPSYIVPNSLVLGGIKDPTPETAPNQKLVSIDYDKAEMVCHNLRTGGDLTIEAIPAACFSNAIFTATIPINDTNQGQSFAPFLTPAPAVGSVGISYLSLNERYFIQADGLGNLKDSKGDLVGNVDAGGSVVFRLPAMPDEGSKITISWSPIDCYKVIKNQEVTHDNHYTSRRELLKTTYPNIKPGSVKVILNGNVTLEDTQQNGVLQNGAFTGFVDYAQGQIYLNDTASVSKASVSFARFTEEITTHAFTPEADDEKIYGFIGKATAGTVQLFIPCVWRGTYGMHPVSARTYFFSN